jgi:hypothetical protein
MDRDLHAFVHLKMQIFVYWKIHLPPPDGGGGAHNDKCHLTGGKMEKGKDEKAEHAKGREIKRKKKIESVCEKKRASTKYRYIMRGGGESFSEGEGEIRLSVKNICRLLIKNAVYIEH